VYLSARAAITRFHSFGGFHNKNFLFSKFWRLTVQELGADWVRCHEIFVLSLYMAVFFVYSCGLPSTYLCHSFLLLEGHQSYYTKVHPCGLI
jgi:methionyl-tRNA synthetase